MQQSGAAEVPILIEDLYKFKLFEGKRLIREFSDKSWNVRSSNKLLKRYVTIWSICV